MLALGLGLLAPMALLASCNALTGLDDIELVPNGAGGGTATGSDTSSSSSSSSGGSTTTSSTAGGGQGAGGEAPDAAPDVEEDAGLNPDDDEDLDGRLNGQDNCPFDFNPCQYDLDNDGLGDACDGTCEEHCSVRTCNWPNALGCNCSNNCPAGFGCMTDYDYQHGYSGDLPLPDGGTHSCEPRFWKVCARYCTEQNPCPMGTCYELQLGSGCICYSWAMLLPCY